MQNKKNPVRANRRVRTCIPAFIRAGEPRPPAITLAEVLNFIDHAGPRQSRILLNAMRRQPWYVPSQVAFAFDGIAHPGNPDNLVNLGKQRRAS